MNMNGIRIEIESQSSSKESPIGEDFALDLVKDFASDSEKDLIRNLLAELQKKSSKHKFLINTCNMTSAEGINANLDITSNFGAVWDGDRDGFITLKVAKEPKGESAETNDNDSSSDKYKDGKSEGFEKMNLNSTLITIYWIYSG